jgi:predicted metal-dependent hydrolase
MHKISFIHNNTLVHLRYELLRSHRQTVALHISPQLQLTIKASYLMPVTEIERIIRQKYAWIAKTIARIKKAQNSPQKPIQTDHMPYLGNQYQVVFSDQITSPVQLNEQIIVHTKYQPNPVPALRWWYKRQAYKHLAERVNHFSHEHGFAPKGLTVKDTKSRWGSCSSKGNLNFCWKLILMPLPVIDYVVVHELVHLKQMNHSREFWQGVEAIIPDWRIHRAWLKVHGQAILQVLAE